MTQETQEVRERQVAIAPLNELAKEDIGKGAQAFDQWLQKVSKKTITLQKVKTWAGVIPVVGNIMALIDALGDIVHLVKTKSKNPLDWVSLGINLIGVVPAPPTMAAARMTLRPTLFLARQTLKRNPGGHLGDAVFAVLTQHVNASLMGELEKFIEEAAASLPDMLTRSGNLGYDVLSGLANNIERTATGNIDTSATKAKASQSLKALYNPDETVSFWAAAGGLIASGNEYIAKKTVNVVASNSGGLLLAAVQPYIDILNWLAKQVRSTLTALANPDVQHSIGWILSSLLQAVRKRKKSRVQATNAPAQHVGTARAQTNQGNLGAIGQQGKAKNDPNPVTNGVCSGSCNSISFARGTETLVHTDFNLPGPFPVSWARTYRSSLNAFDRSAFGARWITPFSMRLDLNDNGLTYHANDGRSHDYPLPKTGKFHYDPVEKVVLVRADDNHFRLVRGHDSQEHYQRIRKRCYLTAITLRGGARIALHYEHQHAGQPVLSDLITYQGDTPHQHIHTDIDDHGRITALWLMHEGAPLRQLAGYDYDEHGDLRAARDENAAQWDYHYQHHLITRYTDRTGRGMNLQWQGDDPHAKAVREWADDGSYDTRLEWDPNIRLTYVTDALGHETWHYYDILGYTYRIVYPDGNEEWLFRDAAKNVTRHIHTDGSTDGYAYDDRGNLLQHTRADGSSIHHAYDDQDQRFKTRDAEGGLWKYDYDPRGNIIETLDPLENKTQYAYNADNLPTVITDALGGSKQLAYNTDGQLTRYTDCSGKVSQWQYDALGQLSRFTDAAGNITTYHYSAGHLVRLTLPDKTEEHFERDAEGRLLSHTDALGQRTVWQYTEAGLIKQRQQANGTTLDYRWDRLGQLLELRNENNACATFKYDPAGHLLKETGFDQKTTHYLYDHGSQQPTRRLDGDRVCEYDYDPLGRLTARHAGQREGQVRQTETFAYDGNGNLLLADNAACKLQWFYDAAGNTTREHQHLRYLSQPQVAVWQHEYNPLNQRIATTRPDGHRVSWLTYGSGHLLAMKVDDTELLSYQRDDLHREIARHQGNGLQQRQSWTPNGQLQEQALGLPGSTTRLLVRNYHYDAAGQLTELRDSRRGDLTYRYDPLGRLLSATTIKGEETFAFDPASNLLDPKAPRQPSHYPPPKLLDNLLRDYVGQHYTYDTRGNLLEKIDNGKKAIFTWDLHDRLTRYEDERLTVKFAYDALGRRLFKLSKSKYQPKREAGPIWNQNEQRKLDEKYGWVFERVIFTGRSSLVNGEIGQGHEHISRLLRLRRCVPIPAHGLH